MFKITENTELNQISLTGARALVLIGLLTTNPRTFQEIKENLINLKLFDERNSDDVLRIDFNTIKEMGCEIVRFSSDDGFKYSITKHPFSFTITKEEVEVLKKVYNYVKKFSDLYTLMEYDELFKKIAFYICDEESKEIILGISVLKHYDLQMIKDLLLDCKQRRVLELRYKKSFLSKDFKKEIVVKEVVFKNDKIYLYGFDMGKNVQTVLNVKRIISIISRKLQKKYFSPELVKIKFLLKGVDKSNLEENEEIISASENEIIVEGHYYNTFFAMQRMLYFGKNCIVLEPDGFKKKLIEKIKEMKNIYEK